jgi:hypothetical protein
VRRCTCPIAPSFPSAGYVEKRGDWIPHYRTRFVKLFSDGTLAHFLTDSAAEAPRGRVSLIGSTTTISVGSTAPFSSFIGLAGGAMIKLRYPNLDERDKWVKTIEELSTGDERLVRSAAENETFDCFLVGTAW